MNINVTTTKGSLITGEWGEVEWGGPSINGKNFFYREGGEKFLYKELCRLEVPIFLTRVRNYNNGCLEVRLTTCVTDDMIPEELWLDAYDLICLDMCDRTIARVLDSGVIRVSESESRFIPDSLTIETYS